MRRKRDYRDDSITDTTLVSLSKHYPDGRSMLQTPHILVYPRYCCINRVLLNSRTPYLPVYVFCMYVRIYTQAMTVTRGPSTHNPQDRGPLRAHVPVGPDVSALYQHRVFILCARNLRARRALICIPLTGRIIRRIHTSL